MLGGIDSSLFLKGFGGFIAIAIFALFLRWAFPPAKKSSSKAHRREIKRSLRELKRK